MPILFISINELILRPLPVFPNELAWIGKVKLEYQYQFFWMLLLIILPTIIVLSKFNKEYFFNSLIFCLVISIGFNAYTNIILNFDRGLLANAINPIILYDYSNITLSLLVLFYGFYLKPKYSYLLILISLLNIILIVMHGSRGAWLGLPLSFLIMFIAYFKTDTKKIYFVIASTLITALTLFLIPNSPVSNRLTALNQDMEMIKTESYNSSIGTRIALWKFAIAEFPKAPLAGVGITQLRENICEHHKIIRLDQCQLHVHNVYLQALAAHGLLGLFSILFLIFSPLIFFIKSLKRTSNSEIIFLSYTGIAITSYLSICFLTDTYFIIDRFTMLFYLVIFTLISLIMKEELKK